MTAVFIAPKSRNKEATGGIPRVVDAQVRWLPEHGIEVVDTSDAADILCVHAATWVPPAKHQRTVSHCHGLYWTNYNWESEWYKAVNEQVLDSLKLADVATVPSQWVANSIARCTWLNPVVIGHGVELDEWQVVQQHGKYILWDKARSDAVCNPRPMNVLANSAPDLFFRSSYGDSQDNVEIIGTVPYSEHRENLQHAALYLATAPETFGISIVEAMACGVPIIGWNWGGQAELVKNKVHGLLVEPGNYAQLVDAARWAIANRQQLSENCRQLVEDQYQWRDVIGQYAQLYKQVANQQQTTIACTIIIPSYNLKAYLPDAIDSALMQGNNCEVIVVDDCSTDGSYELAKSYEPRVRVLRTDVNSNMPAVLNLGISNAKGRYILNLDADNTLPRGTVPTLVGILDSRPSLDIVYGKIKFVLEDGQTPDRSVSGDGISGWPPVEYSYDAQMAHKNQIPSSAMFRKSIWAQSGGYRRRCYRIGEDPDFWCRTTTLGAQAARATDAVTLVYRMRDTSRSHVQPEWPWELWYRNKSAYRGGPIHALQSDPIVSIIVPVGPGHGDQAIADCLDSVYAQDMHEWEVIVVDDTDNEIRWLPSWVRSSSTGASGSGVSVSRNIGVDMAKGQYLVYLDADDYLQPNALSSMLATIQKHGGYVYTDWLKDGEPVQISQFGCADQLQMLHHPITCMYPATVKQYCKFDESMHVGEDWDYVLQVMKAGWCGTHLKQPLLNYRTVSGNNRKGLIDNIDSIRALMKERYGDMGCSCGKGGGGVDYGALANSVNGGNGSLQQQALGSNDLVLLAFVQEGVPAMSWTGPVTGISYRFGSDEGHSIKYVHRVDAEELLKRNEFELAAGAVPA